MKRLNLIQGVLVLETLPTVTIISEIKGFVLISSQNQCTDVSSHQLSIRSHHIKFSRE